MIKVFQIGCGKMSKYTMRYVYEHDAEIVGAVDINPNVIGKDISEIMVSAKPKDGRLRSLKELDIYLKESLPDIAIITTMSLLKDIRDVARICLSNGVNVITTCEEAFFASNSNPTLWKELDVVAKANKCTITGSGYQDIF